MHHQALIGLIGGISWESSAEYYRIINREVRNRLGGVHSARSLMLSVDFGEIERLQHQGDWDKLTEQMKDAAIRLDLLFVFEATLPSGSRMPLRRIQMYSVDRLVRTRLAVTSPDSVAILSSKSEMLR